MTEMKPQWNKASRVVRYSFENPISKKEDLSVFAEESFAIDLPMQG
jgi:hypothetical protein